MGRIRQPPSCCPRTFLLTATILSDIVGLVVGERCLSMTSKSKPKERASMNSESSFHYNMAEIEQEFRRLRDSTMQEYEQELERWREEEEIIAEAGRRYSEQTKSILTENGVDTENLFRGLARAWKEEERELDNFLSKVRPQLIDRDPELDVRAREQAARSLFSSSFGCSEAYLIGVDLLGPDAESIGGDEGEVGNPGTWLYGKKPGEIRHISTGSGSGCVGRAVPVPSKANWWFTWGVPKKGNYLFWAVINYYGFYLVKANDGCFSCKRADISAEARLSVHQQWSTPDKVSKIIDMGSQHIHKSSTLDGRKEWKFWQFLNVGPVFVKVSVSACTQAKGSGSYAEVNFKNGKSAYIDIPVILIST